MGKTARTNRKTVQRFDEGQFLSALKRGGGSREFALFSEEEAAKILRMSVRQLANRRRARKIACIKDGAYVAYTEGNLRDFCEAARQNSKEWMVRQKAPQREAETPSPGAKPASHFANLILRNTD